MSQAKVVQGDGLVDNPAVQGTSDDAAISKLSAANFGYFDDPFISCFVHIPGKGGGSGRAAAVRASGGAGGTKRQRVRRSPLINRGYYARVSAVWEVACEFVRSVEAPARAQIVSLGAGFDSLFFRMKRAETAPSVFVEVDYPSTGVRKAALIGRHGELLKPLLGNPEPKVVEDQEPGDIHCGDYHFIGADMGDLQTMEAKLRQCEEFDFAQPTLFLSECVMVYMEPEHSNALIQWAAEAMKGAAMFVTYEQIRPDDPFGQVMMGHLRKRGCPLRSLTSFPTLDSHEKRYTERGWTKARAWDMNGVYSHYLPRDDVQRIEKLEIFDEFEEWFLIEGHYMICMAYKGGDLDGVGLLPRGLPPGDQRARV